MNLRELIGHKVVRTIPADSIRHRKDYSYCKLEECIEVLGVIDDYVIARRFEHASIGSCFKVPRKYDDNNWENIDKAWDCVYGGTTRITENKNPTFFKVDYISKRHVQANAIKFRKFRLGDVIYIPSAGEEIPFRVEHITDEKAYLVSIKIFEFSDMLYIDKYLDDFAKTLPEEFLDICGEIEHKVNENIIRKSKVTLLSYGNITGCQNCNGADDMQFAGLKTEANRVRSDYKGETTWYWLDTPCNYVNWKGEPFSNFSQFLYVAPVGTTDISHQLVASSVAGVCPCLAISRIRKTSIPRK